MNCPVVVPIWATLLFSILTGLSYSQTLVLLLVEYALYSQLRGQPSCPPHKWLSECSSVIVNRMFTTDLCKILVTCAMLVLLRMLVAVVSVKVAAWLALSWWMAVPLLEMRGVTVRKNQEEGSKFLADVWAAFRKDVSYNE